MSKIAVVQEPPVLLDRAATLERAVSAVERAADGGALLVVFPETYIPGYPDWVWRTRPDDFKLAGALHERLLANAVDLEKDDLGPRAGCASSTRPLDGWGLSYAGRTTCRSLASRFTRKS